MRLDPRSVPYRAAETVARLVWVVVIFSVTSSGVDPALGVPVVVLAVLGVLAVAAGYQFAYWQRFEYDLTPDTFDIRSGVLSRRTREIPYRRVQNVDISRNVLQRFFGVAEVRIETAGGSDTEAHLRFVSASEATRLQDELGRLKRGEGADDAESAPSTESLYAITPRELLLLGAVSVDFRLVSFLSVAAPVFWPTVSDAMAPFAPPGLRLLSPLVLAPLGVLALYLASVLVGAVVAATNYYGFRLVREGDELRYERGLVQRFNGTIPLEKVQTLTVRANVLARLIDHASLAVETAGYAPGDDNGSQSAVPFAERDRVVSLARSVEPFEEPTFERPPKRARTRYAIRYATVALAVVLGSYLVVRLTPLSGAWWGTLALLPVVPPAAHAKWSARGYALQDGHVITRNGYFVQTTKVVPYYRVQTIIVSQSPFQRRRDLATLVVDVAGSHSLTGRDPRAVDIDAATADRLCDEIETRLYGALADERTRRANRTRRVERPPSDDGSASGDGSDLAM